MSRDVLRTCRVIARCSANDRLKLIEQVLLLRLPLSRTVALIASVVAIGRLCRH